MADYRIYLKDQESPVYVDGDEIRVQEDGTLLVKKDSEKVAEFVHGAWLSWSGGKEPQKQV